MVVCSFKKYKPGDKFIITTHLMEPCNQPSIVIRESNFEEYYEEKTRFWKEANIGRFPSHINKEESKERYFYLVSTELIMKITIWFHGLRTPSTYLSLTDTRIIFTDDFIGFDNKVFMRSEIKAFRAEILDA